jgi:hypothetical protein
MLRQLMNSWVLGLLFVGSCLGNYCHGQGPKYLFRGVFGPTERSATPESAPYSPNELMGQPFTVTVSWPESAANYSGDWQTGADYWGSYTTEAISIEVDVPGFDFSIPPAIAQWETWNDTVLEYEWGVPQSWGDELRLVSRADWSQTIEFEAMFQGQTHTETLSWTTDYLFTLRAIDSTATVLDDQSLQVAFDLNSFGTLSFEFQQNVPVSGSDPRPIVYQHWLGIVESIVAVPEPTFSTLAASAAICGLFSRRLGLCV